MSLSWSVVNAGRIEALGSWKDAVFLSKDNIFDDKDLYLGSVTPQSPIPGGKGYTGGTSVTLPSVPPGNYFLFLRLDSVGDLPEADETDNLSAPMPLEVTAPDKLPDLNLLEFTVGVEKAGVGQWVPVTWKGENRSKLTLTSTGADVLILSTNPVLDRHDRVIARYYYDSHVEPGATYAQDQAFPVPPAPLGRYYLFVVLNGMNSLKEPNILNNISKPIQLDITEPAMEVAPAGAALKAGETLTFVTNPPGLPVNWTVNGPGTIGKDGVYTAPTPITTETRAAIRATTTDGTNRTAVTTVRLVTSAQIHPIRATVRAGHSVLFTVSHNLFFPVIWKLDAGLRAPVGTLDSAGKYTAPDTIPANITMFVTATVRSGKSTVVAVSPLYLLKDTIIRTRLTQLRHPWAVLVRPDGRRLVSERNPDVCLEKEGVCPPAVGTHEEGVGGDGGPAGTAQLSSPTGLAQDLFGNLYIADTGNHRVRKVDPSNRITTFAGGGSPEDGIGDGGPATHARLLQPEGLATDPFGNVYIADFGAQRIRKVSPDGAITTFAGTGETGNTGDNGPATAAQFNGPRALTLDTQGNLFVADFNNNLVRRISPDGIVRRYAGTGIAGFGGDGGPALLADVTTPAGLAVDEEGGLFISEFQSNRIRLVKDETDNNTFPYHEPLINTVAGNGSEGYSGDGGMADDASLYGPAGMYIDSYGNLVFVDSNNDAVREIPGAGATGLGAGVPLPATGPPGLLAGDVNIDTHVNVLDGVTALSATVGITALNADQATAADMDGNGHVNVQDVVVVLLKAVGIIP